MEDYEKGISIMRMLYIFIRLILAGIFIYAGVIKFVHPDAFLNDIEGYMLVLYRMAWLLAFYLPSFEILCGVMLLFPYVYHRSSAWILSILMSVFLVAIFSAWFRSLDISCGCFGENQNKMQYLELVLRDLIILVLLIVVACKGRMRTSTSALNKF